MFLTMKKCIQHDSICSSNYSEPVKALFSVVVGLRFRNPLGQWNPAQFLFTNLYFTVLHSAKVKETLPAHSESVSNPYADNFRILVTNHFY
jgi:hypothetical protein